MGTLSDGKSKLRDFLTLLLCIINSIIIKITDVYGILRINSITQYIWLFIDQMMTHAFTDHFRIICEVLLPDGDMLENENA